MGGRLGEKETDGKKEEMSEMNEGGREGERGGGQEGEQEATSQTRG